MPAPLTVTYPSDGDRYTVTKPEFTGTGAKGAIIDVYSGDARLGSTEVKENGT